MFWDHVFSINPIHVYAMIGLLTFLYLVKTDKLPTPEALRKMISMLDDRGGNILVLGLFAAWFFVVTVKLFYHAFAVMQDGVIKADNAILLMALNTVSSGAFGTCFGALLKTMSGAMTVPPPQATSPAGGQIPSNNESREQKGAGHEN